jgi:peptidoglycan hydrolase-like protein with peptidoglycan-binding domain
VNSRPVRLLYGATPTYRDLGRGMSNGPDIRQLEQNLVDLGMDPGGDIDVDTRFTAATSAAVRRWEASLGLPSWRRDGRLTRDEVMFLPGPLRVREVRAVLGTTVAPDTTVLTATSTRRVITAQVSADRQQLVRVRHRVQVSLTGTDPLQGSVLRIGRVATAAPQQPAPTEGGEAPATVTVVVAVTLPPGSPTLDQAPVRLGITTATRRDVLMVPVTALLARSGGGYRVRLADGDFVEVQPGLFDDSAGTVEVTGDLRAGNQVEVPAT